MGTVKIDRANKLQLFRLLEEKRRREAVRSFWAFCLWYDAGFFQKRPFLRQIAQAFQRVHDEYAQGRAISVSVSMPPRAGKSYITSLFCAWWLGRFPQLSVMRNSCTATLYRKFSYDVRNILRSILYQKAFPDIQLADDKQNIDGWNLTTSKQVGYFGNGVGGTIIGFGANLAISDDLYRGIDDALSETYNDGVIRWKESAHDSRKEKNCPEIYIGTRWSKRDVIGKAIEDGKVQEQVKISALVVDADGRLRSFCEDVKSTEEYLAIKQNIDETIFEAEYQQEPIENKGLLFPMSELKRFRPEQLQALQPEYRYAAVDPADKGGDDTSAPFCDVYGNGVYVHDVLFNNDGTDVNIGTLVEKIVGGRLHHVDVEAVSAWVLFARELREKVQDRHPDCEVRALKQTTNKETRILAHSAFIKNHFYFLEEAYWTPEYRRFMQRLTSYLREGGNKRDDAPDSLAMASAHLQVNLSGLW